MELEQIEGTVEDIIYENPDNGYTVFEISGGGTVTVVCGIVGELHAGESVVCRGKYENHATYGRQFHAQESRDRYAEGSGGSVRLPCQRFSALHRGTHGQ